MRFLRNTKDVSTSRAECQEDDKKCQVRKGYKRKGRGFSQHGSSVGLEPTAVQFLVFSYDSEGPEQTLVANYWVCLF